MCTCLCWPTCLLKGMRANEWFNPFESLCKFKSCMYYVFQSWLLRCIALYWEPHSTWINWDENSCECHKHTPEKITGKKIPFTLCLHKGLLCQSNANILQYTRNEYVYKIANGLRCFICVRISSKNWSLCQFDWVQTLWFLFTKFIINKMNSETSPF